MNLKRRTGTFLLAIVLFAAEAMGAEPQENFVVVINVHNDMTSISRKDAELIFLNKKRSWPDGQTINVLINETPKTYDSFSRTILRRSPHQFLVFRKKMLFRGQGMPPPTLKTDEAVIEFVAGHVGGISYVSPDSVTPAVKIITITQ